MTAEYSAVPRIGIAPARLAGNAVLAAPHLRRLRPVILPLLMAAVVLLVWQFVVTVLRIPAVILPPPVEIGHELWRAFPVLLHHAVPTTLDSLMAFFLASALGVGLAIAITYSPFLRDMLYPNLVVFQLIPKVALAPLFVVWLGIGSESRVVFAAFVSFFPVVISTAVGFANVEASALRLCRSLTASEWQCFAMVRFPFALPAIFSGMKIAMTMAVIGVIIGEFISAQAGLGFYILYASSRMETAVIFAALFVLCVIGVALFGAVALAEELVRRSYGRR
ncbi:MAG TPA: ABC transporter permease [Stellaceae bacterium]|nr:ABC transporter permease [Stellaceae bacterium]